MNAQDYPFQNAQDYSYPFLTVQNKSRNAQNFELFISGAAEQVDHERAAGLPVFGAEQANEHEHQPSAGAGFPVSDGIEQDYGRTELFPF